MLSKDLELRKVPRRIIREVSLYLEKDDAWKEFMSMIPRQLEVLENGDLNSVLDTPKYAPKHFLLVELGAKKCSKLCSEILLDEWGTSGKKRPTLSSLLQLLKLNELYQAADYVSELCGDGPVPRPAEGPFATINSCFLRRNERNIECPGDGESNPTEAHTAIKNEERSRPAIGSALVSEVATAGDEKSIISAKPSPGLRAEDLVSPVPHIPYKVLRKITNHFEGEESVGLKPGRKLGSGGTGTVYLGVFGDGKQVAVKRIDKEKVQMDVVTRQFIMEVENVAKYSHPNILEILGYSVDGPFPCVLYDFLPEGSVLDHLLGRFNRSVLPWRTRVRIAKETANALQYFHSHGKRALIHRDVKSANILLNEKFSAKLGDYGFARYGAEEDSFTKTSNIVGTQAYMAPEAFRGDISVKLDTFGFGVVLLELLTGMPAYDDKKSHPGKDLVSFLKEKIDDDHRLIVGYLDANANWDSEVASGCAKIAFFCVRDKNERPTMDVVLRALEAVVTVSKADSIDNQ